MLSLTSLLKGHKQLLYFPFSLPAPSSPIRAQIVRRVLWSRLVVWNITQSYVQLKLVVLVLDSKSAAAHSFFNKVFPLFTHTVHQSWCLQFQDCILDFQKVVSSLSKWPPLSYFFTLFKRSMGDKSRRNRKGVVVIYIQAGTLSWWKNPLLVCNWLILPDFHILMCYEISTVVVTLFPLVSETTTAKCAAPLILYWCIRVGSGGQLNADMIFTKETSDMIIRLTKKIKKLFMIRNAQCYISCWIQALNQWLLFSFWINGKFLHIVLCQSL